MNDSAERREITPTGIAHLRRCIDLARAALEAGDEPFGSLLVDSSEVVRFEDRNRVSSGDMTRHPEFAIARWAAENMAPDERRTSVVYTSGEHCSMCSAAHAWVGLGPIVYATSSAQLQTWHAELGLDPGPIAPLPISTVAPQIKVFGPAPELADEVRRLHLQRADRTR